MVSLNLNGVVGMRQISNWRWHDGRVAREAIRRSLNYSHLRGRECHAFHLFASLAGLQPRGLLAVAPRREPAPCVRDFPVGC
jgi:hypothetical protein